jgi:hypothetical protein
MKKDLELNLKEYARRFRIKLQAGDVSKIAEYFSNLHGIKTHGSVGSHEFRIKTRNFNQDLVKQAMKVLNMKDDGWEVSL